MADVSNSLLSCSEVRMTPVAAGVEGAATEVSKAGVESGVKLVVMGGVGAAGVCKKMSC